MMLATKRLHVLKKREGVLEGDSAIKLSKSSVKNINAQFEADTLYEVVLIDYDDIDISVLPIDGDD